MGFERRAETVSPNSDYMKLREVAKYLGLHEMTVYTLAREGRIPAAKIGGQWRFKQSVLDTWLEEGMWKRTGRPTTPAHQ